MKRFGAWLLIGSLFLTSCGGSKGSTSGASSAGPDTPPLVSLETVVVGNPGNTPDPDTGFGAVGYGYAIGKYHVTIGQYVVFLNAVAAAPSSPAIADLWNADMQEPARYLSRGFVSRGGSGTVDEPYSYHEMADEVLGERSSFRGMPNISWFSAARFANWLHNGATASADTETGSYTLNDASSGVVMKNPDAKWWIPTEDEWYKAAYFDPTLNGRAGGYYSFPFRSNEQPVKEPPPGVAADGVNSANYDGAMGNLEQVTPVGAYTHSHSYYGTFDQGGLLWQWNDAVYSDNVGVPMNRGMRGASWSLGLLNISKDSERDYPPEYDDDDSGFRLVTRGP